MALEIGTFVNDLVVTNPPGSDKKSQGDDHLRLIKTILRNTFPAAAKAFPFPRAFGTAINRVVLATESNGLFYINTTSGAITLTLPTLGASDDGWAITVLKNSTDVNPILIVPASGTVFSGDQVVTTARRCIPNSRFRIEWIGSAWYIERTPRVPLGTILDCPRAGLPVGYEWANGQTLASASANYPEFFVSNGNSGVVQDRRGRVAPGRGNMGGADAGLITAAGGNFDGTVLGGTGGAQNKTIAQNQLPNIVPTFAGSAGGSKSVTLSKGGLMYTTAGGGGSFLGVGGGGLTTNTDSGTVDVGTPAGTVSSINGNVSQQVLPIIPPSIVTNMIVVVE